MSTNITSGSPESTSNSTGVDGRGDGHSAPIMGEGERLRLLLAAARYDQTELAAACDVSKNAVHKWLKKGKFSAQVWAKLSDGLRALGLNPADVRPEESEQAEPTEDLTRLVESWSRVQLSTLKHILESSKESRALLLAYINGSLRDIP